MNPGMKILAERVAMGKALRASDKRGIKRRCDPRMSDGEKMIWAAAYADEYRRATLGMEPHTRQLQDPEAARIASFHAFAVVGSARILASAYHLDQDPRTDFPERAALVEMLVEGKDSKTSRK